MRIVHLNPDPGISPAKKKGASVHVQAMREAFTGLGHEVLALDTPDEDSTWEALAQAQAQGPVQLIYERHALARHAGARFADEHQIPHVIEVNAPLYEEERTHRGSRLAEHDPLQERRDFSRAECVLCVSNAVAEYARTQGAREQALLIRANAVDPLRFQPRAPDDALRASLIPAGRVVLGFHGRLRPWHRFDRIAWAAGQLHRQGLPIQLLLLGEGDFESAWRNQLPAERVQQLAWAEHQQAAKIVACFDLLPLYYDRSVPHYFSPLKLAEAMAAGVVPIVPDLGDLTACVSAGREGLVYPAEDDQAFLHALRRLVQEPLLRQSLAQGARARALRSTWADLARDVLAHVAQRRT